MGRLIKIRRSIREKNATDANGSALEQPGILQRSPPEALACPVSIQSSRRKDYQSPGDTCAPLKHSETSCAGGDVMSASSLENTWMLSE